MRVNTCGEDDLDCKYSISMSKKDTDVVSAIISDNNIKFIIIIKITNCKRVRIRIITSGKSCLICKTSISVLQENTYVGCAIIDHGDIDFCVIVKITNSNPSWTRRSSRKGCL